jgi:protein associated with RNAse G/E
MFGKKETISPEYKRMAPDISVKVEEDGNEYIASIEVRFFGEENARKIELTLERDFDEKKLSSILKNEFGDHLLDAERSAIILSLRNKIRNIELAKEKKKMAEEIVKNAKKGIIDLREWIREGELGEVLVLDPKYGREVRIIQNLESDEKDE